MAHIGQIHNADQSFGTRLGADIGDVLKGLAEQKTQQVKINQNKQLLSSLGINPQVSSNLARKDDKFIGDFLKQYEGFNIGNQNQAPQQGQGYQQNLDGLTPQQQQAGYSPNQPNLPKEQINGQQQSIPDMVKGLYAQNPGLENTINPQQLAQLIERQQGSQQQPEAQNNTIQSKAAADAARAARVQQLKENHEESKYQREKYDKEVKESKDWYKKELEGSHSAKENLSRLNRIESLNKSGNLTHNLLTSVRDVVAHGIGGKFGSSFIGIPGIDLTSVLLSEDSQEFEKLSKDMLSGLSDMYKGRVNQSEVDAFLKTIPSLMQSAQGRQSVIENMRQFTEDRLLAVKEAKKIKDENKGIIPPDLQIQVEERISDRLDETIEKFKNLTHTKANRNENLITSALKAIPRLIV